MTIHFDEASVAELVKPGVYVYWRGDVCEYVGSGHAAGRPLAANHHRRHQLAGTRLEYIPCKSVKEARETERRLIRELKPRLNRVRFKLDTTTAAHEEICEYCLAEVLQANGYELDALPNDDEADAMQDKLDEVPMVAVGAACPECGMVQELAMPIGVIDER
jgi:hypothetical protein